MSECVAQCIVSFSRTSFGLVVILEALLYCHVLRSADLHEERGDALVSLDSIFCDNVRHWPGKSVIERECFEDPVIQAGAAKLIAGG